MNSAAEIKPYLIGVAGPSCAGKTELSRRLAARLDASLLPLDCYYFDLSTLTMQERARFNFDEPAALDHDLFLAQLQDLASGLSIDRPVYDFATHTRTTLVEKVPPCRFIVVEGLFVLYWDDVRELFGTKVFVDLEDEPCLERRIYRDVRERGRTRESVIRQVKETVEPMAALYVRPTRLEADVVVRGDAPIEASVAEVLAHVQHHLSSCTVR